MNIFLIIIAILAGLAIIVWILVLFSNEAEKNAEDAFTPIWMTFLFVTVPHFVLALVLKKLNFMDIPLGSIGPVTLICMVLAFFSGYKALKNYLHIKDENLKAKKLKIDSEYKKRFELIPNLVKVIKSFTENENKTIEKVLESREKSMQMLSESNKKTFDQSVNLLINSAYDYPSLQNMPLYRNLTASLISTQENINYYTAEYNNLASVFNADLKSFPTNLLYKRLNFTPAEYLDENVTEEQKKSDDLLKNL